MILGNFVFLTPAGTSTLVATTKIRIELLDCRTDPDPLAAGEGSGPLITQLRVLEHSLQGGGVCRLRVQDQAKRLHRTPDHFRKQAHFLRIWFPAFQTPPSNGGGQSVVLDPLRYATGLAV